MCVFWLIVMGVVIELGCLWWQCHGGGEEFLTPKLARRACDFFGNFLGGLEDGLFGLYFDGGGGRTEMRVNCSN